MSVADLPFRRAVVGVLEGRLVEPRRFLQVVTGPRQTGKSTAVRQALAAVGLPHHLASADLPAPPGPGWIESQWEVGRRLATAGDRSVLVLDEVQKVDRWSEVVKRLWDEDTAAGRALQVVLLGSSALLVRRGLTESLAGRFEVLRSTHWGFGEMREAFGWDLERFITYGGYPGTAPLVDDPQRWAEYVRDALIETTVSRDILLLEAIAKPALLRRTFAAACEHSAQIVSLTKLLGQLQDAGNTATVAHYLDLLDHAGLVAAVQRFSPNAVRQRAASPKLLALTTAVVTALTPDAGLGARNDERRWGSLVETAVLAHLRNGAAGTTAELTYWRDGKREVDAVLADATTTLAIEVTAGARSHTEVGLEAFVAAHGGPVRRLVVGGQGMPLETALTTSPTQLLADSR